MESMQQIALIITAVLKSVSLKTKAEAIHIPLVSQRRFGEAVSKGFAFCELVGSYAETEDAYEVTETYEIALRSGLAQRNNAALPATKLSTTQGVIFPQTSAKCSRILSSPQ